MSMHQRISGRSTFALYLISVLLLGLVVALAVTLLVIVPDHQTKREAEAQRGQATATAEARRVEVERAYAAGSAFAAAGDWDKAADEFGKAVSLDPAYRDAAARLADAHNKTEATKVTATAQSVAAATARALSEIEAAYQRGIAYVNLNRWDQAKAEFERVIGSDPTYKDVQARLSELESMLVDATIIPPPPDPPLSPVPTLTPTPNTSTRTMTIYANKGWDSTGMTVEAGNLVQIEYLSGLWTYWPGTVPPFDGDGNPERYVCSEIISAADCVEPLPEANKGSLVARIGSEQPIHIGNRSTFRATQSGPIELGMNDSRLSIDYSKNEGAIIVRITITQP